MSDTTKQFSAGSFYRIQDRLSVNKAGTASHEVAVAAVQAAYEAGQSAVNQALVDALDAIVECAAVEWGWVSNKCINDGRAALELAKGKP